MDMRKFAGSKFMTVDDLRDGNRDELVFSVAPGKYDRPVVTFESGDKLSLNVTNVNTLIRAYGPNDKDWIGCFIELSIGPLKYNGVDREGVIVKPVTPPKPVAARTPVPKPPPPKNDMNDDIPF
jgi:hypothetical protein